MEMTDDEIRQRHAALDLEERRARLKMLHTDIGLKQQEAAHGAFQLAQTYIDKAARETDVRQRLFLEDSAKNIVRMFTPGAAVLALPGADGPDPNGPVTLSGVAADIGYFNLSRAELQAIGRAAAQLFREAHGEGPPKQFVDGAARQVSSYFERDRPLLERAVRSVMG